MLLIMFSLFLQWRGSPLILFILSAYADDYPGSPRRAEDPEGPEPAVPAGQQQQNQRAFRGRADGGELPAAAHRARAPGQGALPAAENLGGDGATD